MNETLDSQLSAMFDDELPGSECELLAKRLARDESLQKRWRNYAVIGAAMRGERDVALRVNLATQLRARLATESPLSSASLAVPTERHGLNRRLWQGAALGAVAASVAVVAVFWLQANSQREPGAQIGQASLAASRITTDPGAEGTDVPESYVVPATSIEPRPVMPTSELANYVVAHSEYSSPLIRRNLLSSLVASEPGTAVVPGESEGAPLSARPNELDVPNEMSTSQVP